MTALKFAPEKIETVAIADLKPYERNPRYHPPWQIEQLAKSITKFGFTLPILITPERTIVAGHGRIDAAKTLGIETVPAIVICDKWTEDDIRAYILADNQLALNAEWKNDLLRFEVKELELHGFDLSVLGFSDADLAKLFVDPGAVNDPNEEWQGMPEFDQQDKMAFKRIVVHFRDQKSVDSFAALVGANITEKTKFIWFPDFGKDCTITQAYRSLHFIDEE